MLASIINQLVQGRKRIGANYQHTVGCHGRNVGVQNVFGDHAGGSARYLVYRSPTWS